MARTVRRTLNEWLPDQPIYGNRGLSVATNVYPVARGYKRFKHFLIFPMRVLIIYVQYSLVRTQRVQ